MILAITLDSFSQLTASGIVNGAAYGLVGVGFALILGVTGRFHYAYGFTYTLAAYLTFALSETVGLPLVVSVVLAVLAVMVVAVVCERAVYRPLANRAGTNALLAVFVAALGVGIAGDNLIRILWGAQTKALAGVQIDAISWWRITIINVDVMLVVGGLALVLALSALLRFTPFGRAIKATRSNPEMAQIVGLDPQAVYLAVFAIGTLFAGTAAVLAALKFSVAPDMGVRPIVLAFVVAFLGGTANPPLRIFLTGVLVGLVESLSSLWLSVRWTQTAVFVILLAYLVSLSVNRKSLAALLRPRALPASA